MESVLRRPILLIAGIRGDRGAFGSCATNFWAAIFFQKWTKVDLFWITSRHPEVRSRNRTGILLRIENHYPLRSRG